MRTTRTILAGCALAAAALAAPAQVLPPPQNVLQLQTSGTVEVQQDLLQMTLTISRDGSDPGAVQSQLRSVLEAALAEAKKTAQPQQMEVRTGNFSIYPRNNREGRISGWMGTAELILEGRDFTRISQAAGRVQGMTLGGVSFGLSREQRARVEGEAEAQAIERFKAKAADLAKAFGFGGYTLREVSVNSSEPGFAPRMRMMAADAKVASSEAVPVEPGKAAVTVTVSGSVQLR